MGVCERENTCKLKLHLVVMVWSGLFNNINVIGPVAMTCWQREFFFSRFALSAPVCLCHLLNVYVRCFSEQIIVLIFCPICNFIQNYINIAILMYDNLNRPLLYFFFSSSWNKKCQLLLKMVFWFWKTLWIIKPLVYF